jgi:hypothetical protein
MKAVFYLTAMASLCCCARPSSVSRTCPLSYQPPGGFRKSAGRQGCCVLGQALDSMRILESVDTCKRFKIFSSEDCYTGAVHDMQQRLTGCCRVGGKKNDVRCRKIVGSAGSSINKLASKYIRCVTGRNSKHKFSCSEVKDVAKRVIGELLEASRQIYQAARSDLVAAPKGLFKMCDSKQHLRYCLPVLLPLLSGMAAEMTPLHYKQHVYRLVPSHAPTHSPTPAPHRTLSPTQAPNPSVNPFLGLLAANAKAGGMSAANLIKHPTLPPTRKPCPCGFVHSDVPDLCCKGGHCDFGESSGFCTVDESNTEMTACSHFATSDCGAGSAPNHGKGGSAVAALQGSTSSAIAAFPTSSVELGTCVVGAGGRECSGRGLCHGGVCYCAGGWSGRACERDVGEEEKEVRAKVLAAKAHMLAKEAAVSLRTKGRTSGVAAKGVRARAARAAATRRAADAHSNAQPTPAPTWMNWPRGSTLASNSRAEMLPSPEGRVLLINPTMSPTPVPSFRPSAHPTARPSTAYKLTASTTDDDDDASHKSTGKGAEGRGSGVGEGVAVAVTGAAKGGKAIRCEKLLVSGQMQYQTVRMGVYHILWEASPHTHGRPVYSMASPSNFIYYFAKPG